MGDAELQLVSECIAHLSGPGAYYSAHQRLAVSLETAAILDACKDCAKLVDTCLKPKTSVLEVLRKSTTLRAPAVVPDDLALCIRAITNLQSKLTAEFYSDLVGVAQQYSKLTLAPDETKAAAAELIAVVSVASSLTTLLVTLDLKGRLGLPELSEVPDAPPIQARRLSAMGSEVKAGRTYGPLIASLGSPPVGESLPMMLAEMPFRCLGLVPFEVQFFVHWMGGLYMAGWKVILASYQLGARPALDRAQMEVVAEHYTGAVGCSY